MVTGGALGPSGVAPCFEAMPHPLLRVPLGLNEQIAQPLLQKSVVTGAEQGGLPDFLRRRAEDVHDALSRSQVDRKVFLAVGKVDQVLGEIAVLLSESPGELVAEFWTDVPHRELPMLVMAIVAPVAHQVRLIGIETVQLDARRRVTVDQCLQVGQRLVGEVVHFWRTVHLHDQHTI